MATKIIHCNTCGAEMASSAKMCPQCGAKNKKPIYKKWWFWVLALIVCISLSGGGSDNKQEEANNSEGKTVEKAQEEVISYTRYNVTELFDMLEKNALKAEDTFKGQYVEIEGYLVTIDSSGKYIGVGAASTDYDHLFSSVHCDIRNDEQKQQIMEMASGDPIVVRGKITTVGEILGYSLMIDRIN